VIDVLSKKPKEESSESISPLRCFKKMLYYEFDIKKELSSSATNSKNTLS
jgi:hypothetical protein